MSYKVMKALSVAASRAAHALVVATSTVEDNIVLGIQKLENAAWDVEERIHAKAVSAANALANKEHEAIQAAHDKVIAELVAARRVTQAAERKVSESFKTLDSKVEAVYAKLSTAIEFHQG